MGTDLSKLSILPPVYRTGERQSRARQQSESQTRALRPHFIIVIIIIIIIIINIIIIIIITIIIIIIIIIVICIINYSQEGF